MSGKMILVLCSAVNALASPPPRAYIAASSLTTTSRPSLRHTPSIPPLATTSLGIAHISEPRVGATILSAASSSSDSTSPSGRNPYLILAALVMLYVTNQWSRMLPSFLVSFDAAGQAGRTGRELMNVALNFNAAQYGLLVSYGFTLLYVAFSFPAGIACDIYSRKNVLLLAAAGWSAATGLSAISQSYAQLLGARVLLGITQAFSGPAAHTLISSTFPPRRRATANAIYTSGIYLGGALASVSMVLSRAYGWRTTALIVAASVAPPTALLAFALREPPRTAAASALSAAAASSKRPSSPIEGLRTVLKVRSVRWLLAGTTARLFAGFAIGAWAAPYYRSAFPSRARQYSVINALIVAGGGTFSAVCGGIVADSLTSASSTSTSAASKPAPHRAALIPMLGSLAAIPFWICAVRTGSFGLAMGALLAAYLLAECWYGATISMLQGALNSAVWGTAQGVLNLVQIVANLSPLLLGALHTRGTPLRLLLTLAVPLSYVTTALCFWRAMEVRRAESAAAA